MELQQPDSSGTRVGNGSVREPFGAAELEDLARCIGEDLDDLRPLEEKPSYLLLYLGAKIREFFKSSGDRTEIYLHSAAVTVHRASHFVFEVLCGKLCVYVVFPGTVDSILKLMQTQVAMERKNADPSYHFYMLAFVRQPLAEAYSKPASITLVPCGDYVVGDGDPDKVTHTLLIAGARIDFDDFGAPLKALT
jgi:hypothetical protein